MTAAVVREQIEAAGLEVVAAGSVSIIARGCGEVLKAVLYPKGWRLQNAHEANAATRSALAKRPEDVARYCAGLRQDGGR